MDFEQVEKIFEDTEINIDDVKGDKTLAGFNIIAKYTDSVIEGADADVIYSADIDHLIEKGITEEDLIRLAELGFYIMDEYLATGA